MPTLPAQPQAKRKRSKRQTVSLTLWVSPSIKAELQRVAGKEKLSISKAGGTLLTEALRQDMQRQYGALFAPIIEQVIRKQMRSYSTRLAVLLVRVSFSSEQTRSLVTNILGRHPDVTQEMLTEILDKSSDTAKRNITRRTPQLSALIEAVEQWLHEDETKPNP